MYMYYTDIHVYAVHIMQVHTALYTYHTPVSRCMCILYYVYLHNKMCVHVINIRKLIVLIILCNNSFQALTNLNEQQSKPIIILSHDGRPAIIYYIHS